MPSGGIQVRFVCAIVLTAAAVLLDGCDDEHGASIRARLLWQDQFEGPATSEFTVNDHADDVAVCDGRVFVVGETGDYLSPTHKGFFHVRAYAAANGDLLWEDRVERVNSIGEHLFRISCHSDLVMSEAAIAGYPTLRAYAADSGELLWEKVFDEAGFARDRVTGLVVEDVIYVSRGQLRPSADGNVLDHSSIMGALAVDDGTELWRDETFAESWAFAVGQDRVCTLQGEREFMTRTYSLRCIAKSAGELAWTRSLGGEGRIAATVLEFLPGTDTLIVVTGEDLGIVLRAFAGADGTELWQRHYGSSDQVAQIIAIPDRLLVVGRTYPEGYPFQPAILFVEGRNFDDGETVWRNSPSGQHAHPPGEPVLLDSRLLVIDGWTTFVYDPVDGRLLVEVPAHPDPEPLGQPEVAADDGRYFLVGTFDAVKSDWGTRAYALE